jgi:trans-aconitate methyltransferase
MPTNYETVYREAKQALGEPAREFVEFFETSLKGHLRVLDLGCGQGRDSLAIARLGHSVVGVDQSPTGIRDLLADAEAENLNIQGYVADIRFFEPEGAYDVLLIDRTLHMLKAVEWHGLLTRFLDCVNPGGFVLIADERSNIPTFEAVLKAHHRDWRTILKRRGYFFAQRE